MQHVLPWSGRGRTAGLAVLEGECWESGGGVWCSTWWLPPQPLAGTALRCATPAEPQHITARDEGGMGDPHHLQLCCSAARHPPTLSCPGVGQLLAGWPPAWGGAVLQVVTVQPWHREAGRRRGTPGGDHHDMLRQPGACLHGHPCSYHVKSGCPAASVCQSEGGFVEFAAATTGWHSPSPPQHFPPPAPQVPPQTIQGAGDHKPLRNTHHRRGRMGDMAWRSTAARAAPRHAHLPARTIPG